MLDNEIKEQHVLGTVLPAIFLASRPSCSTSWCRGWWPRNASRSPR